VRCGARLVSPPALEERLIDLALVGVHASKEACTELAIFGEIGNNKIPRYLKHTVFAQ